MYFCGRKRPHETLGTCSTYGMRGFAWPKCHVVVDDDEIIAVLVVVEDDDDD